jgi:hypothetical protein
MAFQQILLGSNKMEADLSPTASYFALLMKFSRSSSSQTSITFNTTEVMDADGTFAGGGGRNFAYKLTFKDAQDILKNGTK